MLQADVRDEEDVLLPRLQTALDPDRSRDHLDRWGRGRMGAPSRAVSQLLARAAGAVEHIPPLTRGERPSTHSGRTGVEREARGG